MKSELPTPPSTGSEVPTNESDSMREQLTEQKDLNLQMAADFDNFKRRSRQESDARGAAQKESFIHELLPAIDNLERALAAGAVRGTTELHRGVEMTFRQLLLLLHQHGIEPEESVGQPFNPHRHEAVSKRHDATHPDYAIIEVLQRGYLRGEKVFRPAKVVVNDLTHSKHSRHVR